MNKRALVIGINDYPGTGSDLFGCVNDALDWAAALRNRGFSVTLLLDAEAKKARIMSEGRKLVRATKGDDKLLCTFSGHGTQVRDLNGDESDYRDEAICPHDLDKGQLILDDELAVLFGALPPTARCVLIADSCHSGTVARMAPALSMLPPGVRRPVARVRYLPVDAWVVNRKKRASGQSVGLRGGTALLLAGCREFEYSYDANFVGRPNGAFTYAALKALSQMKSTSTYSDWYTRIRRYLPASDYPQTPQLVGTAAQRSWKLF
jgi:uncharacterized caspase-like protein